METPKSEKSQTRFSTPVSELDDHRQQPAIPRNDYAGRPTIRRGTLESVTNEPQVDVRAMQQALRDAAPIARDFEHAIADDDGNGEGELGLLRRGSLSPVVARRGTFRRSQPRVNRSRDSSPSSSRSSSPANSVDAFADPRRRERANTVGSKAPSEINLGIQRTLSACSHQRPRKVSNASARHLEAADERQSHHDSAEEDVCFPQIEEPSKTYKIDFEELDEFVVEHAKAKAQAQALRLQRSQKSSFGSQENKPKIFDDLRTNGPRQIPQIITQSPSTEKLGSQICHEDSGISIDEKDGDLLGANGPCELQEVIKDLNRYSFFSSELEQTIHAKDLGDLLNPGVGFRDLFELPEEGGVWWLDVLDPSEAEMEAFQKAFGIHRLTTEDIITQEAREKVELFKSYYFVCFRSFDQMDKNSDDYMEPVNVYMVVFREGILTFTYTMSPHAANVRKRIGRLRDYMALTADWICYAMM